MLEFKFILNSHEKEIQMNSGLGICLNTFFYSFGVPVRNSFWIQKGTHFEFPTFAWAGASARKILSVSVAMFGEAVTTGNFLSRNWFFSSRNPTPRHQNLGAIHFLCSLLWSMCLSRSICDMVYAVGRFARMARHTCQNYFDLFHQPIR